MNTTDAIALHNRTLTTKGDIKNFRSQGQIPCVIYGKTLTQNITALVDSKQIHKTIKKGAFFQTLLPAKLEGKPISLLPKKIQRHPVSDETLHIDFMLVDANTRINVDIPVKVTNELAAPGIKLGGILNIIEHKLTCNVLASNIPSVIEVSISGLRINDTLTAKDLQLPEGIKLQNMKPNKAILSITASVAEEAKAETTTTAKK